MNKIGALWKHETTKGTKYLSGEITLPESGKVAIVVFACDKSKQTNKNAPDYDIKLSEPRENKVDTPVTKVQDAFGTPDDDSPF